MKTKIIYHMNDDCKIVRVEIRKTFLGIPLRRKFIDTHHISNKDCLAMEKE